MSITAVMFTVKKEIIKMKDDWIEQQIEKWEPKTKIRSVFGHHGSKEGDRMSVKYYWDEYRLEWTTQNRAFQGHIIKQINTKLIDFKWQ